MKNLEELQEQMKKGNTYYKKNGTMEGSDLPESLIKEGYSTIKGWNGIYGSPFPPYALSNNNAKIRSTRERIEQLRKEKSKPTTNSEYDWGSVVRNTEDMRLQLLFNSIPSPEVRSELKSSGFRWSPKNQAWQRQLTNNAEYSLKRLIERGIL